MDRASDTLTAEVKVATWDDVEAYFDGPECDKCPYMRGSTDQGVFLVECGLVEVWSGLGRAPEPSDCKGVSNE